MRVMPRCLAALLAALACSQAALAGDGITISGSSLTLLASNGRAMTGPALAGQEIHIDALVLRITEAVRGEGSVPWLYALEARSGPAGPFQPACEPDRRGRRLGVLLAGETSADGRYIPDPERLSVACSSGALGKCLLAGYQTGPAGLPRFQACLRMFRADYCGDGTSWTAEGMVIDVFDPEGIQQSTEPGLPLEAAWGPDGALCVHHTRVPARLSLKALQQACPKALQLPPAQCTPQRAGKLRGALLFNRSADAR